MSVIRRHVIAGVHVDVYSPETVSSQKPLVVFFLLHGRFGSAKDVDPIARFVIAQTQADEHVRELWVVTLDHRNHGSRLIEPKANNAWSKVNHKHNDNHAIDMYSIQTGTARDVSLLIDFLPTYLFPVGERTIAEWGVAGISLGGHSTWIVLSQDSRVKTGIPIIGCPDYLALIKGRTKEMDIPMSPPYIPASLVELVERVDPASRPYRSLESLNPFLGKRVLVLSGEMDRLVPWSASQKFVEGLEVGPYGLKKISLQTGVGHECTENMVQEMVSFIITKVLIAGGST